MTKCNGVHDLPPVCGKKLKPNRRLSSLDRIVDVYLSSQKNFADGYRGLSTTIDFICGRDNKDWKPGEKYRKCFHQRRLTNGQIDNIAAELSDIDNQQFTDFESLIGYVRSFNVPYFKHTNSYDFSFRYGLSKGILPERYVYFHAGARKGALALRRAGLIDFDLKECRLETSKFPAELRQLPSWHIENLLCVMKSQLDRLYPKQ